MKKVKKSKTTGAAKAPRLAAHRERAAKALRDNLQKRKAQTRARDTNEKGRE